VIGEDEVAASGSNRRRVWRRNPLRRASDRIQDGATYLLLMTMLLVAPWAAWSIGGRTYRDDVRVGDLQRQNRFPVTAELLRDAPRPDDRAARATPAGPSRGTLARWTGPDGSVHTGPVTAAFGLRQGSAVSIWVDARGAQTGPPQHRNAGLNALLAALLTVGGLGGALYGLHGLVVWRLDRRRLRAWQQEWLVVEPDWTHR
jgi:hypothetical protein